MRDVDNPQESKGARAIFLVKETSCSTCGLAIEKEVKKLEGVKEVRVSVMLNKVYIDYDSSRVSLREIKNAVDRTGYGSCLLPAKS